MVFPPVKNFKETLILSFSKLSGTDLVDIALRDTEIKGRRKSLAMFQTSKTFLWEFLRKQTFCKVELKNKNIKKMKENQKRPEIAKKLRDKAIRRSYIIN